jgi:SAM-dependent methyltransferase
MKSIDGIGLDNVKAVYSGAEGDLWELVMGEQIHIGGFASSMDLAETAGIGAGMKGVDLCSCNGAGVRFLIRFREVEGMIGVDATEKVVDQSNERCAAHGMADKAKFVLADACTTGLADGEADFVWGEDAWCYVEDKDALVKEAARLVKSGGTIAFTDWVEGPTPMTDEEATRLMTFMKFPNVQTIAGYSELLAAAGCDVVEAKDTGRFSPYVDLYIKMLTMQLTTDALRIIGFDMDLMQAMGGEMAFMKELADAGKIAQAMFIAKKA